MRFLTRGTLIALAALAAWGCATEVASSDGDVGGADVGLADGQMSQDGIVAVDIASQGPDVHRAGDTQEAKDCLLYTSDAADE